MSISIDELFERNRAWSQKERDNDPEFFSRLIAQQNPEFMWIGCSDSRVPANEIIGLAPGEVFVHRNVANVVGHADLNCLSALQYAIDVLHVKHVLIVGHYGCGGVNAAMQGLRVGLADNWLRHVQDVRDKYRERLLDIDDTATRCDLLCELNVIEQTLNVCDTTVVRDAWARGQEVAVHGWIYSLADGLVRELGADMYREGDVRGCYEASVARIMQRG
ncbi:MAG: carbonate dehydratase [Candidatus Dactylopiibacterium carminicum]|uniref:Carbonic anhydrase n=1 Tax=Candidatus Dactylopiibacterium carminicum TaxID=857335 RepID=A0A272EQN4_9RHOO|nr:carbonate dehydratase [Candidatus Dactylopiibacterium carminicum]KAF7598632.1 carbonate dehydratase [Candidatus Dactylopiibacterium carminicum]PAS92398.1 MAG: carbonate dehydratase [Candidatus Dactylopiibacterium carminicum]PAS96009.1 MAG: carbonate dehydratase [Candidatus Dactylopiibacterium carminicum]PAS98399.1 MAG: carbonic anhydrase [Candidatus Dactylopiibacterium carminicum]